MDASSSARNAIDSTIETVDAPTRSLARPKIWRFVLGAVAVVAILAAIASHIRISSTDEQYSGALAMLDRLFDLLLAGGVLAAAFSVGSAIGRVFSIQYRGAAEEISFSVMLGTGALGLATLGLGLVKLLQPVPVTVLCVALVGVTARRGMARAGALFNDTSRLRSTRRALTVAALFGIVVTILILRTLLPPTAFDELIYHLPVTKSFVDQGRVFPVYDNPMGNFPFLIHMTYALCIMAKSDSTARLISLALAVCTALLVYGFCVRFLDRITGIVAMFGLFGAGMVVEVATTSRVDVSLAGMLFAATYAVLVYVRTGQAGWLYMSAILSGLAMGIKYDAGVWVLLIAAIYLAECKLTLHQPLPDIVKRGVLYTAIVAAVASPWYVKNLVWFHNPIYWFATGEVRDVPPQPPRYFTGDDELKMDAYFEQTRKEIPVRVEVLRQDLEEWATRRIERHPLRVWEQFLHPEVFNVGEPYHDPNYLFIVVPLLLLLNRPRSLLWLLFCCVGFFVVTAEVSWVGRYLLPVYPGLTVIAGFVLIEVSRKLRSHAPVARMLPAVAVAVAVGSAVMVSATAIYSRNGIGFLDGSVSRREFRRQFGYYGPIDFINNELPADARIMMLGAELGYGLKRYYVADPCWDSNEWRRLMVHNDGFDEINQEIKRRGITHILVYPHQFEMVAALGREGAGLNGMNPPSASSASAREGAAEIRPDYWSQLRTWATFELYSARYLEEIYQDKYRFHLYRVK